MIETVMGGFGLLEGPVYDPDRGLLFTDATAGGVFCLAPDGRLETVVKHRTGIGGISLHIDGGVIVSGRNIAYKGPDDVLTAVLLPNAPEDGIIGFNDITTDAAGRIYAGSLAYRPLIPSDDPKPGRLHLIDLDGTTQVLSTGVQTTNGMGFSPDGRRLYHADTWKNLIYAYDVRDDGRIGDREVFVDMGEGMPDGLAVAMDGSIWVATVYAGLVIVYNPDGSERTRFQFSTPMITSLCFAGEDLRDVYVVSGSEGSGREDAGTIYRLRADAPGVPVVPARVSITRISIPDSPSRET